MNLGCVMTDGSWHGARMPSDPLIANRHPRGRQPSQRRGATLLPRFDQGCNRKFWYVPKGNKGAEKGWDSRSHDKGTETFSSVDYRVEDEHSSSATITASS